MKKNPLVYLLGISAAFFVIFLIAAYWFVGSLDGGSKTEKKLFSKTKAVGVIEINGVIGDSKKILEQIETLQEDTRVKGIVVRVNSPGGAVAPSQEIYDAIKKLDREKPVFGSMNSVAASGGLYVLCGARKVYANPGTITGSIGVIMQFADLSKLYQWAKVNPYVIKTGKYKDMGSPLREMSTEEKALLQGMAENVLGQFRNAVSTGRKMDPEKVKEIADGRIFSGEQAKQLKLVDEVGSFQDAVDSVAKEVGIKGKPQLIYGQKKKKLLERLFEDEAESESRSNLGSLVHILSRLVGDIEGENVSALGSRLIGPLFLMPHALH